MLTAHSLPGNLILGQPLPDNRSAFQLVNHGKNVLAIGGRAYVARKSIEINEIVQLNCHEDHCDGEWKLVYNYLSGRWQTVALFVPSNVVRVHGYFVCY